MRRTQRGPDSFKLPKYDTGFGEAEETKQLASVIEKMLEKVNEIDK